MFLLHPPYVSLIVDKGIETMNYPDTDLPVILLHLPAAPLPYLRPIPLPPPLLWPCSATSTSTVSLFPYLYHASVPLNPSYTLPLFPSTSILPLFPYSHLYRAHVPLLPPLPCPCSLTSTSIVPLFPYFHIISCPCSLTSTSTMSLFPYFHLYPVLVPLVTSTILLRQICSDNKWFIKT